MKEFFEFVGLMLILFGLIAAIPVLGVVVGIGAGIWVLWNMWKGDHHV